MVEKKKKIISEKDIKIMFNNIDQILSTHKGKSQSKNRY